MFLSNAEIENLKSTAENIGHEPHLNNEEQDNLATNNNQLFLLQ